MYPISRPVGCLPGAVLLLASLLLAASPATCLAQGSETGIAPLAAPDQNTLQAPLDPTEARIRYLHERLRITPAQEPLWVKVAQVMRDNAASVAPLARQRLRSAETSDAIDNLGSYEKLGEAQLDGLRKFLLAFKSLYAQFSDQQKKIADSLFRLAPLSMIGGIPQLAEQLIAPEPNPPSYAMPVPVPVVPLYVPLYRTYPYPFYAYTPFYNYYPPYGPWLWGPPFVFAGSFLAFKRFRHRHAFFLGPPFAHRGFFPGKVGHPRPPLVILPHRR